MPKRPIEEVSNENINTMNLPSTGLYSTPGAVAQTNKPVIVNNKKQKTAAKPKGNTPQLSNFFKPKQNANS